MQHFGCRILTQRKYSILKRFVGQQHRSSAAGAERRLRRFVSLTSVSPNTDTSVTLTYMDDLRTWRLRVRLADSLYWCSLSPYLFYWAEMSYTLNPCFSVSLPSHIMMGRHLLVMRLWGAEGDVEVYFQTSPLCLSALCWAEVTNCSPSPFPAVTSPLLTLSCPWCFSVLWNHSVKTHFVV